MKTVEQIKDIIEILQKDILALTTEEQEEIIEYSCLLNKNKGDE